MPGYMNYGGSLIVVNPGCESREDNFVTILSQMSVLKGPSMDSASSKRVCKSRFLEIAAIAARYEPDGILKLIKPGSPVLCLYQEFGFAPQESTEGLKRVA